MRNARTAVAALVVLGVAIAAIWYGLLVQRTAEHGDRMALDVEVGRAMDAPGGPDFAREVAAYRRFLPEGEDRALNIALAELASCKAERAPCDVSPQVTEAQAQAELTRLAREGRSDFVRSAARDGLKRYATNPIR